MAHLEMGAWEVISQPIGSTVKYTVIRVKDIREPCHAGNIIHAALGYVDEKQAESYAAKLCHIEAQLPVCPWCGHAPKIWHDNTISVRIRCITQNPDERFTCYRADVMEPTLEQAVEAWSNLQKNQ